MNDLIPPVLWRKIEEFVTQGKSGQIVLNASDGRIQSYQLTEHGRIPAPEKIDKATST